MRLWLVVVGVVAAAAAVIATSAFGVSAGGKITTLAGRTAHLRSPQGLTVDRKGNLYIADYGNQRVRKVSARGTITTIAGTGAPGFSGDGGPAVNAQLSGPNGVAVDGQGNVYFTDFQNNRVRKVSRDGTITTIAGTGTLGFSGDGGKATSAQLYYAERVAVDGQGNVYIADERNFRVRKVGAGGTITTIAGTGTSGFSGDGGPATSARLAPNADGVFNGLAVDRQGNVYIADSATYRVRKVSARGTITTIAGTGTSGFSGDGGPGTSARLYRPAGITVDGHGSVYIATVEDSRVRKVRK